MTTAQKTTLLRRLKQGAFWLTALLLPGGSLLALVPWLRHRWHKDKNAPCEGC
ncbi:MAG TPA: hypothetical protein VMT94_01185 [Burkholderiales bacterium]|nr:hypothetical protein [Burkholderiales bacterium]